MNLEFDLTRPDPLYFAWKKAVNTLGRAGVTAALREIEEKYGCQTLDIRRKDGK